MTLNYSTVEALQITSIVLGFVFVGLFAVIVYRVLRRTND